MGWASLLLTLVAAIVVQFQGSKGWLEEEKRALLEVKESVKLHNASMDESLLPSWVSDPNSDSCGWERVTCNTSSGQVIHLSLDNVTRADLGCPILQRLNMSLFLSFKHLKNLNLSINCFDHLLEIEGLKSRSTYTMLETLDLSHNYYLNQSIMKPLSGLTCLKNLILASCYIGGPLPLQELSLFRNLELLDLSYNLLSSPLTVRDTSSLFKLEKLTTLDLSDNLLDKNIFKYLVALPALKSLYLSYNFQNWDAVLNDKVLANLSNLEVLILRSSRLNGSLPIQGLCRLMQLQELDLSNNDLTGTLDPCLGNLTSLRALDLSYNSFNGRIPASFIAPLTSLEYLSLSNNNFEGSFSLNSVANHSKLKVLSLGDMDDNKTFQVQTENPPWIPSFQLEYLRLSYFPMNLPTRTIPTFLLYQHDLKYVDLSNNNLVGMFPSWLLVNNSRLISVFLNGNSFTELQLPSDLSQPMDHLSHLKLSDNKFRGKLPINMGYFLPYLKYLDVSSNMFEGDIPASIGEMSNLMILDLSYNNFSGKIPKYVLLGCVSLDILRISNNNLQGNIFSRPMNLGSLEILMADNNQFNGTLEDGFLLTALRILDISSNNFSGMLPGWIMNSPLYILSVSSNNFEGTVPSNFCKTDLIFLDLSHNRFSGAMPSCLFKSSLEFINLRANSLTGTVPKTLSRSSSLVLVDLSDNKFSGTILESFHGLPDLTILLLEKNELEGELSNQVCQLQHINILDLSHNKFTGSIPSCINNMSFGSYSLYKTEALVISAQIFAEYYYPHFSLNEREISYDHSYGQDEVPFVTKSLSYLYKGNILQIMSGIDLSSNQLTGEIPHQIGNLHALHSLNLSHNHLNGTIPESLRSLKEIESLDLSYNNLNGKIPLQLQELHSLTTFNVSYNNLSGKAPDRGQFANFDESNYKGNPYLSWSNSNRRIPTPQPLKTPLNDTEERESSIDLTAFTWSFVASYVVVLLTLVAILCINPYWRRTWFHYINICLQKSFGRFFEVAFF